MSDTPPPIVDDNQSYDAPAAATSNDIDLGDEINLNASPEHDNSESLKKPQVLSDDLFFSAIAEPSANESSTANNDDMDEIFSSNRAAVSKEIRLDDDDENGPFSTSNLNGSSSSTTAATAAAVSTASINVQPVLESSASKPSLSDDAPKLSPFAKPVSFFSLEINRIRCKLFNYFNF
jgi:hypothetical protein